MGDLRALAGQLTRRAARPRYRLPLTANGVVALTFDDGPDPLWTPQVLDVLADLGAKATFFLVGQRAVQHPELVRRIAAEGHAVGSHSWSHPVPWTTPVRSLRRDYARGHAAVVSALGRTTSLFRPPHGHLGPASTLAVRSLGLRPVLWTTDLEDWKADACPARLVQQLGRPQAGDVVLLHDALAGEAFATAGPVDRTTTVQALPKILERLDHLGLGTLAWPAEVRS